MHDGDVRYFSGVAGSSYFEFAEDDFGDYTEFSMDIYRQELPATEYEDSGTSTYGYSYARDVLFNYGQKGPIGAYLYFNPAWELLSDGLLLKGGSRSSRFYAGVPDVEEVLVSATVKVKAAGTVTVPAGTFHDCRSVSFTLKAARGGGASGQAMILAPRVGPIKMGVANVRGQFIGWQSLTGGTVGGVDVRELAIQIPPTITTQPRGKSLNEGKKLRLFVRAKGPGPLQYQWRFNDSPIPDADESVFVLPGVAPGDGGNYSVVVSNSGGAVTSAVATVVIRAASTR